MPADPSSGYFPAESSVLRRVHLRFGELFGMPREVAPATYAGFRDY